MSLDDELHAFVEDRKEHVADGDRPALARGDIVLLDRYYFSTIAYQGARGGDVEAIRRMNEAVAPRPDLVLLIDFEPEAGAATHSREPRRHSRRFRTARSTPGDSRHLSPTGGRRSGAVSHDRRRPLARRGIRRSDRPRPATARRRFKGEPVTARSNSCSISTRSAVSSAASSLAAASKCCFSARCSRR